MTYSKRTRGVTSGSPASTAVEPHALVGNNLEETTSTEGLRVCLSLDLQDIKRKKDNFTNTNQTSFRPRQQACVRQAIIQIFLPSSSGVHDGLSGSLSKGIVKCGAVVLSQVVTRKRLATIFVDSLHNLCGNKISQLNRVSVFGFSTYLIPSSISQTREEGSEFTDKRGTGIILEDNLVEGAGGRDLNRKSRLAECHTAGHGSYNERLQ